MKEGYKTTTPNINDLKMNNPHDGFFKETMTRRENAISFFRGYLPNDIAALADWRTLRIVKETFITPELKERFSDIVYTVRIRDALAFIYFLLEHQSTPDFLMPLRFYHYIGDIWELHLKQNPDARKLPVVIPILFYHGKDEWNISPELKDMIDDPGPAARHVPNFEHILHDLSTLSDSDIRGNIAVRLFLSVTRRIFSPDFGSHFDKMLPLFVELSWKRTGMEYLETVLRYVYDARDDLDPEETETKLVRVIDEDKKEAIMTVAERLRQEGEIRGEIKTYKKLLASGFLSKELVDQKLDELNRKLKKMTGKGDNVAS